MKLVHRTIIVVVVLAGAFLGQTALLAHLEAPGAIPPGELTSELDLFPLVLEPWHGRDVPIDNSVDEVYKHPFKPLQRGYVNVESGQQLSLWMVYSAVGEDRGHHPEVCYPVHGQPEDFSARAHIEVDGHPSPVQQLRYGNDNEMKKLVYYWHYTLPPQQTAELNGLQQIYHRLRQRPASITLQVFAPEMLPNTAQGAIEFVRLVDEAIQPIVGPGAVRGCQRLPVTMN